MARKSAAIHPEHAAEQAYIEHLYRAAEQSRVTAERTAVAAGDKYAARTARKRLLERFGAQIDAEALCFGRIDQETGRTLYLGRGAIHDDGQLLVVNWRVPAAEAFYTASRQDPQGLSLRRRFQVEDLRLLNIVDDRFGSLPERAEQLSPAPLDARPDAEATQIDAGADPAAAEPDGHVVDAILSDMDRARGGAMRDIVATIEAEQYRLISDRLEGVLVIQGGPGSGKTAIALHRAAWLLFNHREQLERSGVLVVGPNRAFMEYVAAVLPSLGEGSVVQSAVDRLLDLEDVRVRAVEARPIAALKGDPRLAAVVRRAVHARVRRPDEAIAVEIGRRRISLPPERVGELIDSAWRANQTYLAARDVFRRDLVALSTELLGPSRGAFSSGPRAGEIEMAITGAGGPLDRLWPTVTAAQVVRDLLSSRQRLRAAAADQLSADDLALLYRDRQRSIREEPWTAADIPLLDEAQVELRGSEAVYGYVLADEAQDLSPMQLRMVLRRSAGGHATLVGDIAQATGPARLPDWTDLLAAASITTPQRIAELAIGYRVPRQIMELASGLLPRIAPDLFVPRPVREGPEAPTLERVGATAVEATVIAQARARCDGDRTVGVIAPADAADRLRAALTEAGVQAGDVLIDGLTRQVTVLSAEQAKGLEFDHVIVVEPVAIAGASEEWAYVYIALTRATRTLAVVHTTPQPFDVPPPPMPPTPVVELGTVAEETTPSDEGTILGARYTEALMQAKFLHALQKRRGTLVPYFAHLQAVAALVLEDGGSEDEAIAALLHDAVEDHGTDVLDRIVGQFGPAVARIVAGCTDPDAESWRERKETHLRELEAAGPQVRRVALAEKLDNARALLRDYRRSGDRLWARMEVDPDELLWYFISLADLFVTERPGDMASDLQDTVERLLELASEPEPVR